MKSVFIRRHRRRNTAVKSDSAFFKKESQETFLGGGQHDTFFQPVTMASALPVQTVQRKCAACEKEDKQVQREPDKKEEEKLMRAPDLKEEEKVQRQEDNKEEEKIQREPEKKEEENIHREPEKKEEEKVMRAENKKEEDKLVQKKEVSSSSLSAGNVSSYISTLNGKGHSLPASSNQFFSSRMGYDLSHVKVHTGKDAAESAKDINAKAYTAGNNIVFNEGQYNIETSEGKKLMAHELAHVIQQDKNEQKRNMIDRKTAFTGETKKDINLSEKYIEAVKNGSTTSHVGITTPFLNGKNIVTAGGALTLPAEKDFTTVKKGNAYESTVSSDPENNVTYEKHIPVKPGGNVWTSVTSAADLKNIIKDKCKSNDISVHITGKPDSASIISKVDIHETAHVNQLKKVYTDNIVAFDTYVKTIKNTGPTEKSSKIGLKVSIKSKAKDMYNSFVAQFNESAQLFHNSSAGVPASFSAVEIDTSCMWIKSNVTI